MENVCAHLSVDKVDTHTHEWNDMKRQIIAFSQRKMKMKIVKHRGPGSMVSDVWYVARK